MVHQNTAVRAQRVPGWLRALIAVPCLVAAGLFCVTQSGPYRWLADLQMQLLDAYFPVMTGLFVVVLFILPAALLIQIIAARMPADRIEEADRNARARLAGQDAAIQNFVYPVAFVGLGIVALIVAAGSAVNAMTMGELTPYTLGGSEEWPPESRWLDLRGRLDLQSSTSFRDDKTHTVTHYIPFCTVASDKAVPSTCPLVAVVNENQLAEFRLSQQAEGTLWTAPTGIIRQALEDAGADLTDDARTFHVGHSPARAWEMTTIMGTVGAVSLVGGLLVVWWKRRRM